MERRLHIPETGSSIRRYTAAAGVPRCGYGGVNESGEGIGQIVRTEEDITAEKLLPGNEGTEDYEIVMCDASGALMNRAGDYYRTENRDISTVYIFLCTSEDFSEMTEYYQSEKIPGGCARQNVCPACGTARTVQLDDAL